jgi:hypothetical protein
MDEDMRYDVVAIIATRRGVSKLRELVSQLPPEFGAAVVCLAEADGRLVSELSSTTSLRVKWTERGEVPKPGCLYVSPPGTSIVMTEGGQLSLAPVGVESTALHPVDAFLASLSRTYGDRALALILAAFPDDGVEGAQSFKRRGGTVLVLDRATGEYLGLADPIVHAGSYDRILTVADVANALRASFTGRDLLENAELHFELTTFLDSALRISGTHMGSIRVSEPVSDRLHIVAHRGLNHEFLERFSIVHVDDQSPCGKAFHRCERVVIENLFDDRKYEALYPVARAGGFSAMQCTPIRDDGHATGVISTLYAYPHMLSAHEARSFDEIAAMAGELITDLG